MSDDSRSSETKSPTFDPEQATRELEEIERIFALAAQAQDTATRLREIGEAKLVAIRESMPLPLFEAVGDQRH